MKESLKIYIEREENEHAEAYKKNDWKRWPNMRKELYKKGECMTLYTDIPVDYHCFRLYHIIFDHFDFENNQVVGNKVILAKGKKFRNCDFEKDITAGDEIHINFDRVTKFFNCIYEGPDM